ncbi:Gfo/Idh/MocA family protein [Arcticibacterium luteifluviistationis]|uniref:Oxidoreductase n=1 Tax=Arcticibacterium luteifluviistationis TaxID=1784714 RepID=A0A2Z4G8W6_9BACT|nr:Gfo/Idh/MocA family oxidoreductase [Arcticibacterium luteifluviistationis]AWV97584.1 oxidoreductase [Arcticibacterium luteifluviistationis]
MNNNRRDFLKKVVLNSAGVGLLGAIPNSIEAHKSIIVKPNTLKIWEKPRLKFAVIGMNHGHIYSMTEAIKRGGGELVSFYAKEAELNATYAKRYPEAKQAKSELEILENKDIKLVLSAGIPVERAPLGIRVMQAGKDYMSDKPGITTLKQLAKVRKVQKETGQIYTIVYSERLENRATVKASELVQAGAIGKVVQTIGLGPHRMRTETRPDWFFDMNQVGGIITDIASHQFDQFLHFTNSTEAKVLAAQVKNVNHPQYPGFEDFGDAMVQGNGGSGYIRIDWFSPEGLNTWGDGRLTILGTEGYIEIRKNIDIAKHDSGNHLYLVDNKETVHMDCKDIELPFGSQMVDDVLNRTNTAMSQEHCFLTMELALKAQKLGLKTY